MDIFKTLAEIQAQLTKIEQKLDDLKFLTAAGPPPRRNYDHLATAPRPSPPPRPTTPPRPSTGPLDPHARMDATKNAAKEKLDRWIKDVKAKVPPLDPHARRDYLNHPIVPPTKKEGEF